MNKILPIVVILIILGGIGYALNRPAMTPAAAPEATPTQGDVMPAQPATTTSVSAAPASTTPAATGITAAIVATHASQTDCWTIVSGKVYDVTSVISSHPGGPGKIIAVCGTDGTSEFAEMNKFAQGNAMKQMASLLKGDLAQ